MLTNRVACVLMSVLSAPTGRGGCQPDEIAGMRCWFEKTFRVETTEQKAYPCLTIETSHDQVQKNSHMGDAWLEMVDGGKVWLDDLPASDGIAMVPERPPFSFTLDGMSGWAGSSTEMT